MRTKNFLIFVLSVTALSTIFIIFNHERPATIQNIVSTTHQQIRNFKDTLRDAETKTFVADEKHLARLGLTAETRRLYPDDMWYNSTLPVIVTYVMEGQESQAVGLINNLAKLLPNNSILVYNLGLGNYGYRTLLNYCNSSRCIVIPFKLNDFPSHIGDESLHAFRPLIIQDALQQTGAILFLECNQRLNERPGGNIDAATLISSLFASVARPTSGSGILTWPMQPKNAVSSLTHKKMFDYFHTDADNFLFLQMVSADQLLLVNRAAVHADIMLPWVQCALTQDCIVPIGAQSGGCRFDKKPQYRYSGCHSYDTSALNIVLGLKFKLDSSAYMYSRRAHLFHTVTAARAAASLLSLEQNATTTEMAAKNSGSGSGGSQVMENNVVTM